MRVSKKKKRAPLLLCSLDNEENLKNFNVIFSIYFHSLLFSFHIGVINFVNVY